MKRSIITLLFVISFALAGCGDDTSEYKSNLQSTVDRMLDNSSQAETILNQYANVWSSSIKSQESISLSDMAAQTGIDIKGIVNHFEINDGKITNDFSSNIHALISYYTEAGELVEIKKASEEIRGEINELNDPPEEYKKVYDEVLDMYTFTDEYTGMAANPTGSLQDFNEARSQLSNDILNKYKRIEAIMPSDD